MIAAQDASSRLGSARHALDERSAPAGRKGRRSDRRRGLRSTRVLRPEHWIAAASAALPACGPEDQPQRRPARPHQPADRHLVRDGHHDPAALPRLLARASRRSSSARRRPLPGRARWCASRAASPPTAGAATRRSPPPATALSAVCKLALPAVGQRVSARSRAVVAARPDRQGHPHRAARRADLAEHARARRSASPSACTARWTPPGAMLGPLIAFGLLALAPRRVRRRLRRQLLLRRSSASACSSCSCATRRRPRGAPSAAEPVGLRDGARPAARQPRFRGRASRPRALGLVTVSDGFIYLAPASAASSFTPTLFPLLFVGTVAGLHAARRAGRPARRPRRARARVPRRLRRCCSASTPRCCCPPAAPSRWSLMPALLGAYYAATDGVLMALGAAHAARGAARQRPGRCSAPPPAWRGCWPRSLFGALWTVAGIEAAVRRVRGRRSSLAIAVGRRSCSRRWPRREPAQALAFAALCGACRRRGGRRGRRSPRSDAAIRPGRAPAATAAPDGARSVLDRRRRSLALSQRSTATTRGSTAGFARRAARRARARASRCLAGAACDRVDFAAGRGLCLADARSRPALPRRSSTRDLQDARLASAFADMPSRARVSPDGRCGAITVFVTGHSYADAAGSRRRRRSSTSSARQPLGDLERVHVHATAAKPSRRSTSTSGA